MLGVFYRGYPQLTEVAPVETKATVNLEGHSCWMIASQVAF